MRLAQQGLAEDGHAGAGVAGAVSSGTALLVITLSFVPKILAAMATLAIAGPWMITTLVEYIQRTLQAIPGAVG